MKPVTAHITYHGKPICECQYPASIMYGIQCEYASIAEARRVATNIRHYSQSTIDKREIPERHYAVKVVRGNCPTFAREV